jgi:imidazolonepropionase-like amidohydrolase
MTVTPEEASDAGQATLEHTETLFEGTFSAALKEGELPDAIARFRVEGADTLFARFVKNKTISTPTLVAYQSGIEAFEGSLARDPRSRYVALSLKREAEKRAQPVSPEDLQQRKKTFAQLREVVGQMNRSGVILMAGTDLAGPRIPGFTLHDELALLAASGLTPLQALQSATIIPAKLLAKTSDFGTVEKGKVADLVLLDANPLDDIANSKRIFAVVLRGKVLTRKDLNELLDQAAQIAGRS